MRPMHSDPKKQAFNQSMHDGDLWDYESFLAGYEAAEEKFFESQENAAAQVEQSMPSSEWLAEALLLSETYGHLAIDAGAAIGAEEGQHAETALLKAGANLRAHLSKRVTDDTGAVSRRAIADFCRRNRGWTIPADGEVRG